MEFKYTDSFYLDEEALKEIIECVEDGCSIEDAIDAFQEGLDDCDYFDFFHVEEQVKEVIRQAVKSI